MLFPSFNYIRLLLHLLHSLHVRLSYSPVPSYVWSRKGAPLPKGAVTTNYNRVLILPQVSVEDQGEYVCRAFNDRAALENSVMVSIQAEPNFTIPLTDKHMDFQGELTWTCEAFGIPDVNYTWFKNGEILRPETLPPADRARYRIQDNVLNIKDLDSYRDAAMYQCRASNQLRTRYSSAQLRVLGMYFQMFVAIFPALCRRLYIFFFSFQAIV